MLKNDTEYFACKQSWLLFVRGKHGMRQVELLLFRPAINQIVELPIFYLGMHELDKVGAGQKRLLTLSSDLDSQDYPLLFIKIL